MKTKKNILFLCVENANRSQMAQAFAKIHGGDMVNSYSAGSKPSGIVNPKAVEAMKEIDYDLGSHESVSVDDVPDITYDYAVTMGCGDECPFIKARKRMDWDIPDPKNLARDEFREIRNLIEHKVKQLLEAL